MSLPDEDELERRAREVDPQEILQKLATPAAELWAINKQVSEGSLDLENCHDTPSADLFASQNDNTPGSEGDFEDCVAFVTAIVTATSSAALGNVEGGAMGEFFATALSAGGGIAVARLVCRRVLRNRDDD